MITTLPAHGMDTDDKLHRSSSIHGPSQHALSTLLRELPCAISILTLDESLVGGPIMLYYGIDPDTLAHNPEQMSTVLDFLARTSRDIELATGRPLTCVAVAA